MAEDATQPASPRLSGGSDSREAMRQVFEAARRFVACRERAAAMAMGRIPPATTLAEAIERDFLGFDLEEAERQLREAVVTADPLFALLLASETPSLSMVERDCARRIAPR